MKSLLLIFLFAGTCVFGHGDMNEYKKEIDAYKQKLDGEISKCSEDEYCSWYKNHLVLNQLQNSWRAVGLYVKEVDFWYYDEPWAVVEENENASEEWALCRIDIRVKSSYMANIQYYFKEGEFVCYLAEEGYEGEVNESKYYVHHDQMASAYSSANNDKEHLQEEFSYILRDAKKLQQMFLLAF